MLTVRDIKKYYGSHKVLDGVSLRVEQKKITYIFGTSGGGKSPLVEILIGAVRPDSGEVGFGDTVLTTLADRELDPFRKRIGMLFQHGALLNSMTVGENIALPIREHTTLDDTIIKIMVKMKLDLVGLRDFEDLFPGQISGGMQKRVALARALALDPEVVFFDEPTSGLDPIVASVITKLISDMNRVPGLTRLRGTPSCSSSSPAARTARFPSVRRARTSGRTCWWGREGQRAEGRGKREEGRG